MLPTLNDCAAEKSHPLAVIKVPIAPLVGVKEKVEVEFEFKFEVKVEVESISPGPHPVRSNEMIAAAGDLEINSDRNNFIKFNPN